MNELISVIVPIYNVEKYLDKCIQSIVNQTYKNLEIILVDDGSTDSTPAICDKWKEHDSRISVIHKENTGAGDTRNVGFTYANGEWVAYIDSDDYLNENLFEYLLSLADDETDLVECRLVETPDDNVDWSFDEKASIITCDAEKALEYHINDGIFRQTPPNKIYRKRVVEGIDFPVGKLIDDEFWTYRVIGKCRKLVHSDNVMYAYRQQDASAMHKSYSLKRLHAIEAKLERLEYLKNNYPKLVNLASINLWQTCMYQYQMSLLHLNNEDKKIALDYLEKVVKNLLIDKSSLDIKNKLWLLITNVSFSQVCKIRNILKTGI